METSLIKQDSSQISLKESLSAEDVINQVKLIQKVMDGVMKNNDHYGKIPGCGPKPTLFKSGAEKLCLTFRLAPQFSELPGSTETDGFVSYKIKCDLIHIPTGDFRGSGLGACNSKERKYRNASAMDIQNTIYKMACKRALVAAVLVSTAASDIFTQDLEDLSGENNPRPVQPVKIQPVPRQYAPPQQDQPAADFIAEDLGATIMAPKSSSSKPINIFVEGNAIKVQNWPFMKKDTIKNMGYMWEQATKSWVIPFSEEELERIKTFSKDFE